MNKKITKKDQMNDWVTELNNYGKQATPVAFFIAFDGQSGKVIPLKDLDKHDVQLDFPSFSTSNSNIPRVTTPIGVMLKVEPVNLKTYEKAFAQVQYHLHRGDSYLTNLTFATPISLNIDLNEIYMIAKAKYKILFKDDWVCFSPETFIEIQDKTIRTFPMKGTIDASLPNASQQLKTNKKEVAEHHTVVDLLRNDLSHVANHVGVKRLMYLEELKTQKRNILQMSSEISGELSDNWQERLGSIFKELLPAGSISGAPKNKTLDIIKHTENHTRGFYTGISGIFDGKNVDSCVMIRFIEKTSEGLMYKSGGGITAWSNLEDEYQELNQKIYVPIY